MNKGWESGSDRRGPIFMEAATLLRESGFDASCREYSGRGMHGVQCWAITTGAPLIDVVEAVIAAGGKRADHPRRSDSMGLDKVYY